MTAPAPAPDEPATAAPAADQSGAIAAYVEFMNDLIQAAERADADMRDKKSAADYAMTPGANASSEALFKAISEWAHARGYAAGVSAICHIVERHKVVALGPKEQAPPLAPAPPALTGARAPAPMSRAEKRRWERRNGNGNGNGGASAQKKSRKRRRQ